LNTKGAFIYGALHSGAISQVVDRRVDLLFRNIRFCPVEDPSFIRACSDTVPASNTPVVIYNDDSVRFLPGCMDRTYLHAGRLLALLTLNGEIDKTLFRYNIRIIIVFGVFEID
jgi:hypothetical protein